MAANKMRLNASKRVGQPLLLPGILIAAIISLLSAGHCLGQGMGPIKPRIPPPKPALRFSNISGISLEDIAESAGITFHYVAGDRLNKKFILETTGSGAAIFDYDGDGLPDIFLVNGRAWQEHGILSTSHLFRNLGHLHFQDVTQKAGLVFNGWGQGVCSGDYDNDGHEDLLVTYYGHNVLYHNDGNGHFTDVTKSAGLPVDGERWSTGCSFFDYDRDGHLDIAISNYVNFDPKSTPLPGKGSQCEFKGLAVLCGPRGLPGGKNILYRNRGNGIFKDVSVESHFDQPRGHYCFSVVTDDFDGDGWPDAFLACDSTPSILEHNNHDGTFTDVGISAGVAFNENGAEQGSMGADAADFNHSGRPSLAVTTFDDDIPSLFLNNSGDFFTQSSLQAGLGYRTHQVGWGAAFVDLDNDGWQDLFLVNGHVYPNVDLLNRGSHFKEEKNLYYNLRNGTFADITEQSGPGTLLQTSARGLAYGDLNNDGTVELLINNLDSNPNLLINRGPKGNWISLKLVGTHSNRDAIGAHVTVKAGRLVQTLELRSGCCYMSQSDTRLHFGLGGEVKVDLVEIAWPGGDREGFEIPQVNTIVTLKEGLGKRILQ